MGKAAKQKALALCPELVCKSHYQGSARTGELGIVFTVYEKRGALCSHETARAAWARAVDILKSRAKKAAR